MSAIEEYADAILSGRIVACKRIKQIYEKLLYNLENPGEFHFDQKEADRHIQFIEKFCKQSQGKIGEPIHLELFQKAKFEALFGFVDDNGVRQYNEVLTIEGRKNGKTTESSCMELDLLVNDKEGAPEIYNIATKRDQAKKGYDECWRMVSHSPQLRSLIRKRQSDLFCTYNFGTIAPLASKINSLDGLNAHAVIIDELAAIKDRSIYDDMKQAQSARRQPILACITTNGFLRNGIFDAQRQYAYYILDGKIQNEHFLPIIYELDDPDEWLDESCWIKANPGLGPIKSWDFLRQMVEKAKVDPAFRPTVLVKDFNITQNSAAAWLRWEDLNNENTFDVGEFDYCIGGIDAADTTDLNAAKAVMMRPGDPNIYVKSMYWIPETVLNLPGETGSRRERDNAPYQLWVDQGLMRTYAGARVDKAVFLDWFRELRDHDDLYPLYIGYDPWHIDDSLLRAFKAEFGERCMIPVRQGVISLSEPMKNMKADLQQHRIIYNNNPIDKWCLLNTDIKADINGNIQPVKQLDARKRIDGTVALIIGYKVLHDKADEYINLNKEKSGNGSL